MSEYSEYNKQLLQQKKEGKLTAAQVQAARNAWFDNGGQLNTGSGSTTPTVTQPTTPTVTQPNTPYSSAAKTTTTPQIGTAAYTDVPSSRQATPTQPYTIGTQLGSDYYNQVKSTGKSATLTDGSVLSLGADGNVYAFKNGVKMPVQVNYKPTGSTAQQNTTSGTNGAPSLSSQTYNIGTQLGSDYVNQVKSTGKSTTLTDGTVLSLGADGNVYAFRNGVKMLVKDNYKPITLGTGTFNADTKDLKTAVDKVMETGNKITMPDGTVISKGPDGKVYAIKDNVKTPVNVTYKDPNDTEQLLRALVGLFQGGGLYADSLRAQQEANDAAVRQAVNGFEQQKAQNDVTYADLFRQLYIDNMRRKKNIGQQMAEQGITGGASETTMLNADTAYSDALRQGYISQAQANQQLDRAITDARLTGDIQNAQAAAELSRANTDSYADMLRYLLNRADSNNSQIEANNQSTAYSLANMLLSRGEMPDQTTLDRAGISYAEAQRVAELNKPTYSESQVAMAVQAARNSSTDDSVRAIIEGYYGLPMETVVKAYADNEKTDQQGYTSEQAQIAVATALKGNKTDSVRAIIEGYYGLPMESVLAAYQ